MPLSGGYLLPADYADRVMGRIQLRRELRLASFRGLGLRRLSVAAGQLTGTDADTLPQTVRWAAASHRAGLDGVSWTSRRCNDAQAVVLFGDVAGDAVEQDVSFGRYFAGGPALTWLIDVCAPLRVDVLPRH